MDARRPVRTGRTVPTVHTDAPAYSTGWHFLAGGESGAKSKMLERSISTVEDRAG